MSNQPSNRVGIDGLIRPKEDEVIISRNVASVFESEVGKEVLKYLRSITIEYVNGPTVTTDELRHIEGQRYLVGVIEQRIRHAHNHK
tara:strand:+ start:1406 stop:1666 length:261 start_codon:yes stop_codon:yes gene_type:complete